MHRIAVLEFEEELLALSSSRIPIGDICIYCPNPLLWKKLEEGKIPFTKITDQFLGSEEIHKMLVWTREKALSWFEHPDLRPLLEYRGVNFGSIVLSDFRHALLQTVQNFSILRGVIALEKGLSNQFIVFTEDGSSPQTLFHDLGNRSTVNQLLDLYAGEFDLETLPVSFNFKKKRGFKKQAAFQLFKRLLSLCTEMLQNKIAKKSIYVCGGLNHLDEFFDHFKAKEIPFVIFGEMFNHSQWDTAKRLGVPYQTEGAGFSILDRFYAEFEWIRFRKKIQALSQAIRKSAVFHYENHDLSRVMGSLFRGGHRELKRRFFAVHCVRRLIHKQAPSGILLDEDTSYKRVYAAVFRAAGRGVFVVSHGVAGADYRIRKDIRSATYGDYFCNSTFEYEQYRDIGWDPELLHVVGVPRYDKIFRLKAIPKQTSDQKVVLYCPHRLTEKYTRAFAVSTSGYETNQNTLHLIRALQDLPHMLWIKPHGDAGDIPRWMNFEKENPERIKVFSPSKNVLELLRDSDMLVTTFSSVVIEGLLFNLPVITINFTGRPDFRPYARCGVTRGVYNPFDLKQSIEACLFDEKVRKGLGEARNKYFSYFCGFCDGNNTQRALDIVLREANYCLANAKK